MSTVPNNVTRSVAPKSLFPSAQAVTTTQSYNQGDLLVFDDSANVVKKPSAESEGSTFLGVAVETIVSGKLKSPYTTDVDSAQAVSDIPGPLYGVVAKLLLRTGDTLAPGDAMYLDPGVGTNGVSVTGTKAIGIYQGAAITSSAAGTLVEILLGARFPNDALKFYLRK